MALNYLWAGALLVAFVCACFRLIFLGDTEIFAALVNGVFASSRMAIMDIALPLAGMMAFWLGILNIGEKAGAIRLLSKLVSPFFSRLFPEIPRHHPAHGQMMMNFSANMLGLDNAATPFGLKAMTSLQACNPAPATASNAQIMFLVLHTSGLTLLPISIIAQRAILGAQNPTDIFLPCLIATYAATLAGIVLVALKQGISLCNWIMGSWLIGLTLLIGLPIWAMQHYLNQAQISMLSQVVSNFILFTIPVSFTLLGWWRKIEVFSVFIEGAKGGLKTAVKILPYLVAMLALISVLRNSGIIDFLLSGFKWGASQFKLDQRFIDALPVAMMKPISGSGARALMVDTMQQFGPDSLAGRLACVFQGSADSTFYIVALYFGSVGLKNIRYAISFGLLADLAGIVTAIGVSYLFFG